MLPSSYPGGPMTVSTETAAADAAAPGRRSIAVSFVARRNGGGDVLVYMLNVHVRPRPVVVDQVAASPPNTKLTWWPPHCALHSTP